MKKTAVILGLVAVFIAVILLLSNGAGAADGPSVNLVSVQFREATALETTATFTLRLSNELPEPVTFSGGVHKIYLNGLYIGKGLSDATITVPRLSTVTNDVTVHLSNLAMITRIKSVLESKSFEYRVQSLFYGQKAFSRARSETTGKLQLSDFMPTESNTETNAAPTETEVPATAQPEPPANP